MNFSTKQVSWLASILSLLIISIVMVKTNFVSRENDTRLYNRFVKQLADRPLLEVVAPKWNGMTPYAEKETPYVRDHLPGQFLLPVILVKLGFSKEHTHYFVNTVIRIITIWLFYLVALKYLEPEKALYVPLLIQLVPMNFTYQLRANHEHWLLMITLFGVLACLDLEKNRSWFVIGLSVIASFFIKGLAFIPIAAGLLLYLILNAKNKKKVILAFILTTFALLISCGIFEWIFREAADGVSFFTKYFDEQIINRSVKGSGGVNVIGRLKSLGYYSGRLFAYSAPFSIILIYMWVKSKNKSLKAALREIITSPILLIIVCYVLFFSTSTRTASRYIYPAFFLMGIYALIQFLKDREVKVFSKKVMFISYFTLFTTMAVVNILTHMDNHLKYAH